MEPSSSIVEHHEFLGVFLQPFSLKQKAECHVKKGLEGTSGEGSPMAKPRPLSLVMAKPRPLNLVLPRKNPPQDLRDPLNRGMSKKSKQVFQLNSPQELSDSNDPGNAKAEQGGVSNSVVQLTRGVETHMNRPNMEFRKHINTWERFLLNLQNK